jgi:hypothetical protein
MIVDLLRSRFVSFEYLSGEQQARYRRFLADPSPGDLERFFYLDAAALAEVAKKRRDQGSP